MVAIPTGIISAGFVERYTQIQNQNKPRENVRGTVSITVDESSPFVGRGVKEIEEEYKIDILVFIRNGAVIVPVDLTEITVGDILIYQSQNN